MTLMIGTSELAERLYVAWRERMEFVEPLAEATAGRRGSQTTPLARVPVLRPPWRALTAQQQGIWKHVAEAAGRAVYDALDAAVVGRDLGVGDFLQKGGARSGLQSLLQPPDLDR